MQKSVYGVHEAATSAPQDLIDQRVMPTEFWLWWITDEFGERRMTTYRMSCQVALERYPDARRVPGTVEIRNLPDSGDEKPAGLERRNPTNPQRGPVRSVGICSNSRANSRSSLRPLEASGEIGRLTANDG